LHNKLFVAVSLLVDIASDGRYSVIDYAHVIHNGDHLSSKFVGHVLCSRQ